MPRSLWGRSSEGSMEATGYEENERKALCTGGDVYKMRELFER